jgi:peptidoglycan/xylan/chitin deacetylase (PgdA/CDA1 family)
MRARSINLTFHGVGEPSRALEPGEADFWVSTDRFEALLDVACTREDVRITFDDGNGSDLEHALPALLARGLGATFFVVAGRLGSPGFLTEDDVRELARAGMSIGSHGMSHRPWHNLDDATQHEEIVQAKAILERVLAAPVTDAACPFGLYDRRALQALRRAGYRRVYTSDGGSAADHEFVQARTSIGSGDGPDDPAAFVASCQVSAHRALPRWAKLAVKRWR